MDTLAKDLNKSLDESIRTTIKSQKQWRSRVRNPTMAALLFMYIDEKRNYSRPSYMDRTDLKIRITRELLKEAPAKKLEDNKEEFPHIRRTEVFKKILLNKMKRQIDKDKSGTTNPKPPGRILTLPTGKFAKKPNVKPEN